MVNKRLSKCLNALLVFASVFAALLALEIITRIMGIGNPPITRPDPLLGVRLIPNAKYRHDQEGYSEGRINSLGLRDNELAYAKENGETRIIVLGDSFMEAMQVDLDKSFAKLLQKHINEALPGKRINVINGGRSGMGTTEEYLWYRAEGVKYKPEIVLLAFYIGNDFRDNSKALTGNNAFKPFITFDADTFEIDNSFKNGRTFAFRSRLQPVFEKSLLITEATRRVISVKTISSNTSKISELKTACPSDLDVFNGNLTGDWDSAYAVTKKLITLLSDEVTSNSSKFCVMLIPDSYQVYQTESNCVTGKDLRKPNRFLRGIALSRNIPLFDLTDTFVSEHLQTGNYLYGFGKNLGNGHWNENGHLLAAQIIASEPEFLKLLGEAP
jgi:hypothetical protein